MTSFVSIFLGFGELKVPTYSKQTCAGAGAGCHDVGYLSFA